MPGWWLWLACAPAPEVGAVAEAGLARPAPGPVLQAEIPAVLVAGWPAVVHVRGALPGATVEVYGSPQRGGDACPGRLGTCLDLGRPARRLGSAIAGRDGSAEVTVESGRPGDTWMQVASSGGGPTSLAPAVRVPVLRPRDDRDGDGLTNAEECALGTNATVADTDGDGWTDGQEVELLGSNPLDPADGGRYGRGVWFWRDTGDPNGAGAVVGDVAAEEAALAAMAGDGIRRIYASYDWTAPGAESAIVAFHTRAHAAGRSVELLLSENTWIDPMNYPALVALVEERLLDLHAAHPDPAERFDAVHLDIEPQGLPAWSTWTHAEKRSALYDLAATFAVVRATLDAGGASDVPVHVDLPVWFDNLPPGLGGTGSVGWLSAAERDAWFFDLAAHVDEVSWMAFERSSLASIQSGVAWEMANVPLVSRVAVEADVGPGQTWADAAALQAARAGVEAAYGPLAGTDMQSWSAWRPLLP